MRQIFRLDAMPPGPKLCRRCFPSEAVDVDEPEPVTEKEFCQRKAVGRVGAPPLVAAAWEYPRSAGTEGDPLGGPPALSRDGP